MELGMDYMDRGWYGWGVGNMDGAEDMDGVRGSGFGILFKIGAGWGRYKGLRSRSRNGGYYNL